YCRHDGLAQKRYRNASRGDVPQRPVQYSVSQNCRNNGKGRKVNPFGLSIGPNPRTGNAGPDQQEQGTSSVNERPIAQQTYAVSNLSTHKQITGHRERAKQRQSVALRGSSHAPETILADHNRADNPENRPNEAPAGKHLPQDKIRGNC